MRSPFFSIIIPTYNSAETLAVCMKSIIIQSYQNFEIIIIDGQSIDNTCLIAEAYTDLHKNIKICSEKDNGIYDAMNKGIKIAKGEWLYFMGCDDKLFDAKVLDKIANVLEYETSLDVIYGNVISSRFNGSYDGEFTQEKILNQNICHQSIFFKKSLFDKIGYFITKYKSHSDWEHNFRWFLAKQIKKKHVDIIIADYGDGGFSSRNPDHLFYRDKKLKYILYGHRNFSFRFKFLSLAEELLQALKYRDFIKVYSVLLHTPFIFY